MNQHITDIIESQRAFFLTNATKSVDFRIQQLRKLRTAIEANEKAMYEAIDKDFKKSEFDTYTTEIAIVYQDIDAAIKHVKDWASIKKVGTNAANLPAKSYIVPEPLGNALVIGAWNYPYQLSFAPAVAAIAAGCTIILKPSELPTNTSTIIKQIVEENFQSDYFAVIEGGVSETSLLLNQKFDKIFFTGSATVGKIVYRAAAEHLTPVTLELGGKCPGIIAADCKIDISAKRLVWAKFLNAGQTCIAPDYLVVHKSIKDVFIKQLIKEIKSSSFSFSNGNYVQIINEHHFDRLTRLISKENTIYGGNFNKSERYIEPTILSAKDFDVEVMKEEIFGPILPILEYESLDELTSKLKALPKPLACYVFTESHDIKSKVLSEMSFGGGGINEAVMHISNIQLPFGGVGSSGIGSYHGEAGFRTFTHYKSILEKTTLLELNLKYHPHTDFKFNLIKKIMKWQ
jgi:aldehyde dehydrogenase (NAD+)